MKRALSKGVSGPRRAVFVAVSVCVLAALAQAQFDVEWVGFVKEDARLLAEDALGLGDTQEKDYFVGDLDRDGWDDLVVVRKQPFTSPGRRANVLFMNEGGVLVDRTAEYASASTVAGDLGFLTPTNDRDVVFADVDGDGWLDVITATTLTADLKHLSHPRIYMNLGQDGNGDWLGLRYEEHRFPQLHLSNGQPCWPRFCGVAAGDVTGNGLPDLYFVDYDLGLPGQCGDMDDRLLINDGTGVFVDESATRMQPAWLASNFGTSAEIRDMNGDGLNDIVKNTANLGATTCSYNDPGNPGFFALNQIIYVGGGYHMSVGDLNRDGRLDVIVSDDGPDRFLLNQGNDALGRVDWSSPQAYEFVTGGDGGIAGTNIVADLDNDGWPDTLHADCDVNIPGCGRRMHIYNNRGGAIGGSVTLREEAGSSGWRGAVGLMPSDLEGTFDVAVIDIDRDRFKDLVIGRCAGTAVWMNTLGAVGTAFCSCDGSGSAAPCGNTADAGKGCRNSSGDGAELSGSGSASVAAHALELHATKLLPQQPALLFAGNNAVNGGSGVAFGDGLRCAGGGVVRLGVRMPNAAGEAAWGPGVAPQGGWSPGTTRRLQGWYRDPVGSPCNTGFNLTNGYEITFTP